ncbi:MAG: glycoside hydrolase family 16 protein [Acidobacteriota bacterium]
MGKSFLGILGGLLLICALASSSTAQNWTLTWADEFDGETGTAPNSAKWGYDIGGNGWGNNELQYYTNRLANAYLDGQGNLVIKTLKERYTGADGVTREYTSARLLTKGKFEQRYGKFEARIKVPYGQGIWPAFWMLGNDLDANGWPRCGEIDIMENIGKEPSINHGSLHGPGYSGANPLTGIYTLAGGQKFSDDFHTFAVEWFPTTIRFYVDGNLYHTKTANDVAAGNRWVFDHPFFMILNIAIGGNFPGNPDDTTVFPQSMTVDYVRVYADSDSTRPKIINVTVKKKDLRVSGENFDSGAKIFMNDEQQKTLYDEQNANLLIGKKLAKKISPGQTVILQVRNADGTLSEAFNYTRP